MPRIAAWELLRSGNPTPLRALERTARRHGLDERDTRLLRRIIGTEVRRRGSLRAIVRTYAHGKPKADLVAHLHLALVQLLFLDRVPDHAALSTSAEAVARTLGQSKVRITNGILRTILRDRREGQSGDPRRDLVGRELHLARDVFHDPREHPLLWMEDALSLPASLAKRWEKRFGAERARALAAFFLEEPPLVLRADGVEREALRAELAALDVEARPAAHPRVLVVDGEHTAAVLHSDAFLEGRLSVQGEHALGAAELVQALPGERVLELCAAPGGKSCVLALAGARVFAADLAPARLGGLLGSAARLGVEERVHPLAADGAGALAADARFDAVLIDAPCSNTGVLGARPAARWRFGPKHLSSLVALQARLLREGARHVRPGGRLVWSTCSLEPEENERQVRALLEEDEAFTLEAELSSLPGPGGPADGGWAARLRRRG